jgi:arylamine N-acetyltransferase
MPHFVQQSEQSAGELLQQFLHKNGISTRQSPREGLHRVASAFAQLPYENLTKIIRAAQTANIDEARRLPQEVLQEHWSWGTGGTCFSLTWTLLQLVRALGWQAEPILADRRYGADTHCAIVVWIDGEKHLLDPGYLLVDALALPKSGAVRVQTAFNQVELQAEPSGTKVNLITIDQSKATERLTYKTDPVDTSQFLRAWDASFDWEMMTYPVLSWISAGRQLYLQKNHLLTRSAEVSKRIEVDPQQMVSEIAEQFGIAPSISEKALAFLKQHEKR